MYEMKGALSGYGPGSAGFPAARLRISQSPGLTVPDRLVSQPHRSGSADWPASLFRFARLPGLPGATRRPPVPGTHDKYRFPGLSRVPGEAPGWCPFPAVNAFLRPLRPSRKSRREFILTFFRIHTMSTESRRLSAYRRGYPRPYAQLIHRLPDVARRVPAHTTWMPLSCRSNDVDATSTPYDLVRAMPAGLKSAFKPRHCAQPRPLPGREPLRRHPDVPASAQGRRPQLRARRSSLRNAPENTPAPSEWRLTPASRLLAALCRLDN